MQSTERPALTVTGREVRPRHLHDFARECTVGTMGATAHHTAGRGALRSSTATLTSISISCSAIRHSR